MEYLDLNVGRYVNVHLVLSEESSADRWATRAIPSDDASKVCLRLSATVNEVEKYCYIHRDAISTIAQANALYDWMQGRLVDPRSMSEEEWDRDRMPYIGLYALQVHLSTWDDFLGSPNARGQVG